MCGIVGITGGQPVVDALLEGLKRLEYRGYDSAGIAVIGAPIGISRLAGCSHSLPMRRNTNIFQTFMSTQRAHGGAFPARPDAPSGPALPPFLTAGPEALAEALRLMEPVDANPDRRRRVCEIRAVLKDIGPRMERLVDAIEAEDRYARHAAVATLEGAGVLDQYVEKLASPDETEREKALAFIRKIVATERTDHLMQTAARHAQSTAAETRAASRSAPIRPSRADTCRSARRPTA